jgi:hypothetical protein
MLLSPGALFRAGTVAAVTGPLHSQPLYSSTLIIVYYKCLVNHVLLIFHKFFLLSNLDNYG